MVFEPDELPENPKLKEWFSWRETVVTEHQRTELIDKLGDEIVLRAHFLGYLKLSKPPVKLPDGRAKIEAGTRIVYFTLTASDGHVFYPVFTDIREMEPWKEARKEDPLTVVVSFDDFAPILMTNPKMHGIVFNPFSDSFPLLRDTVMAWSEQKKKLVEKARRENEKHKE